MHRHLRLPTPAATADLQDLAEAPARPPVLSSRVRAAMTPPFTLVWALLSAAFCRRSRPMSYRITIRMLLSWRGSPITTPETFGSAARFVSRARRIHSDSLSSPYLRFRRPENWTPVLNADLAPAR